MKNFNFIFIFSLLFYNVFSYRILDAIKGGYNYIVGYYNAFYLGLSYSHYLFDTNRYTKTKLLNQDNSYRLIMNYVYPYQLLGAKDSSLMVGTIDDYTYNEFTDRFPITFNENIRNVFFFSRSRISTTYNYNNLIVWTENKIYYVEPVSDYKYNIYYTFPYDSKDYIYSVLVTENKEEKLVMVFSKRDSNYKVTIFSQSSSTNFSKKKEIKIEGFSGGKGKLMKICQKGHYVFLATSYNYYIFNLDEFGTFWDGDILEKTFSADYSEYGEFNDGISLNDGDVFLSHYSKKKSIYYNTSTKKIFTVYYTDLLYDTTCSNLAQTYDDNHGIIAMTCYDKTYFIDLYNERKQNPYFNGANKKNLGIVFWVVMLILGIIN